MSEGFQGLPQRRRRDAKRRLAKELPLLVAILLTQAAGPLLSQTPCSDGGPVLPKITVHIYNYAQVSRRELAEAEREASRVLADAGLETEWVPCPVSNEDREVNPACARRLLSQELVLNILRHPNGPSLQYGDTFGYAQVFSNGQFGHYAYLFYDRIEGLAGGSVSAPQLLGGVVAHEIGHLLLGSTAHTSRGLMSARWDRGDLERLGWGRLIFDQAQAEHLRAGVLARCGGPRG